MPGSVLLVGGNDRLAEVVAAGIGRAGGEALVHLPSTSKALAAVKPPGGVEAVCVGPQVAKPLRLAQRIAATDRELAVVLVAPADEHAELERQRLFTPFLGPDVTCRPLEEAAELGAQLSEAARRTRARRRHRAILAAAKVNQHGFSSPHPVSGRHLGRLLDRAPIGAVTLNEQGGIRGWNQRAQELLSFGAEAVGAPLAGWFASTDRQRLTEHLTPQLTGAEPPAAQVFERLLADGRPQFLEISAAGVPIDTADGAEAIVALQDVTDRVHAEGRQRTLERELDSSRRLLEAVVGGAADAVFIKDEEGRYLLINQAGAHALGHQPDDVVGRTDAELMPGEVAARLREDDQRVMASGEAQTFEEVIDRHVTYLSTKVPYRDRDRRVAGVLGTARDISERKRDEQRALFLNRAGEVLMSLDPATAARGVAEVAVPEIADLCVVSVLRADGRPEPPVSAHATAHGAARLAEVLGQRDPEALVGERVLRSGRGVLVEEICDEVLHSLAVDAEQERLLRELRIGSVMVVPLPAPGGPLGTMVLARHVDAAPYDEQDLRLAEELGRRAALSIHNARLHSERTRVAAILQSSLLPPSLAPIPGGELALRFHAPGEGVEVGGDFYDAFVLRDGVALVIGDVSGKGPSAAAVTALARYTIRAMAMVESRPDRILGWLNEALLRQRAGSDYYCTVALAHIAPTSSGLRLELVSAGHPLPLLVRADGDGEQFGVSGTLLGAVREPDLPVAHAELGPGDACILYTDGLNEAAAPRLLSPENLLALLRPVAGHGAHAIADRLDVIPVAAGEHMRDDTALAVLAVPG